MAAKDPNDPSTTSAAYDMMAPKWALMEALLGGTDAMRAAGEAYCPMHEEETEASYTSRLQGAVLFNMVEQTLDTLSGKPFSESIKVNEDVPKEIAGDSDPDSEGGPEGILYDVDLQGNNLDVFARKWFREGMAKAFSHVLVDMPRPLRDAEPGKPRTLADDRAENRRPYWIHIKPECVLFARAEIENGAEVLKHVRIAETYTVQQGFAEVCKPRIRILEPGLVELWEPHPTKKKDGKPVWIRTDTWNTGLKYVPMVTFYADREDFMVGKPPLLDLAHLNATHWQSTSEQRHILKVARFPLLACSGASADDSDPVVIGPNKILYNEDAQGKFYYVEHTGASIEAGRKDLEDLERQMSSYGAEFTKQKPGNETATAKAIDTAETSSDLAAISGLFEDAIAQALDYTAEMMALEGEGGTVGLVKNYNQAEDDDKGMTAILEARKLKDLSRKAHLEALRQRGFLPEDFDADLDAEELLEEQDDALARAGFDLDPLGRPIAPPELDEDGKPVNPAGPPAGPGGKPPAKVGPKPVVKAAPKKAPAKKAVRK